MDNPYEGPVNSLGGRGTMPLWYTVCRNVYWPAWLIGAGLIACSWFRIVSNTVGWIGFVISGAAVFVSYLLSHYARANQRDYVGLDSRLLATRGESYRSALERFRGGAPLIFDGAVFQIRSNADVVCMIAADPIELDDSSAREIASHASSVFNRLSSESEDFATSVADHTFHVSVVSSLDPEARELCRITNGSVDWRA